MGGAVISTYDVLITTQGPLPHYIAAYNTWSTVMLAISLTYNWVVIGLIIARLWYLNRNLLIIAMGGPFKAYNKLI